MSKQLGDFLKEQQEPFALEVYLLERGYLRNSFNSEHNFSFCSSKSSIKILNRSASCALHKKRRFITECSKIARTFVSIIFPVNNDHRIKNFASKDQDGCIIDMKKSRQKVADDENFSPSISTVCSNGHIEATNYSSVKGDILPTADSIQLLNDGNLLSIKEFAADRKKRRNAEENYQLSPVSVLADTKYDDGSPVSQSGKYVKRLKKASPTSISTKCYVHFSKNKKALLQSKQLLFDCVKEIIENQRRNHTRAKQIKKILGAEELQNLIYEKMWLWSKETIDECSSEELLHFDPFASMGEWSNFDQQIVRTGKELGDAIFEDMSNQIIAEMINFVS